MKVLVVFQFDNVSPGSPEDEEIVEALSAGVQKMATDFDANACWVQEVFFDEEIQK